MTRTKAASSHPPQRRQASVKLLSGFQKLAAKYQSSTSYVARNRMTKQEPWRAPDWIEPPLRQMSTRRGRERNDLLTNPLNSRGATSVVDRAGADREGYTDVTICEHQLAHEPGEIWIWRDRSFKLNSQMALFCFNHLIRSASMKKAATRRQQEFRWFWAKLRHKTRIALNKTMN